MRAWWRCIWRRRQRRWLVLLVGRDSCSDACLRLGRRLWGLVGHGSGGFPVVREPLVGVAGPARGLRKRLLSLGLASRPEQPGGASSKGAHCTQAEKHAQPRPWLHWSLLHLLLLSLGQLKVSVAWLPRVGAHTLPAKTTDAKVQVGLEGVIRYAAGAAEKKGERLAKKMSALGQND